MKNKPPHFLLFFLLLAFTGQVLAAPLLACPMNGHGSVPAGDTMTSGHEDCSAMPRHHNEHGHDSPGEHQTHASMADSAAHSDRPDTAASGDCDHACLHCFLANGLGLPVEVQAPAVGVDGAATVFPALLLSHHREDLLRPPILA